MQIDRELFNNYQIRAIMKRDMNGVLIEPVDEKEKCGWGKNTKEAVDHYRMRNGL